MRTIGELAELACGELPENWELVVSLEQGCGVVLLYDPNGERVEDATCCDSTIEEQVIEAIGYAKATHNEQ